MIKKFINNSLIDIKKISILIFLIALLPRFIWFFVKGRTLDITIPAGGDAIGYDKIAVNLIKYRQYATEPGKPTASREPVYPYFLAIIYFVFGLSNYTAVRVIQIFISSLTCVMVFLLALDLFNKKIATLAGLVSCFWPHFIYYSTTILRETLFCFLLVCSVYSLNKLYRGKNKIMILLVTGIICAFTALTNSTSMVFLFFGFISILLVRKIKQIIVVGLIFSIIYSLWVIRNYRVFKTFVIGSTIAGISMYGNLAIPWEILGTPEELKFWEKDETKRKASLARDEVEANKIFVEASLEIIKKDIWNNLFLKSIRRFIKLYRFYPHRGKGYAHSETLIIFVNLLSYGLLFPFFIFSFFYKLKEFKNYMFLYLPLICFTVVYSLIWAVIRYRLPLEPYIIIFSSFGITKVKDLMCLITKK